MEQLGNLEEQAHNLREELQGLKAEQAATDELRRRN
jgi:hypothetical protein